MRAIDADELEDTYKNRLGLVMERYGVESSEAGILGGAIKLLKMQPTITPERKRRGKWIKHDDRAGWYCSECVIDDYYAYFYNSDTGVYELQDKFCPNCGTDMRGEHEHDK